LPQIPYSRSVPRQSRTASSSARGSKGSPRGQLLDRLTAISTLAGGLTFAAKCGDRGEWALLGGAADGPYPAQGRRPGVATEGQRLRVLTKLACKRNYGGKSPVQGLRWELTATEATEGYVYDAHTHTSKVTHIYGLNRFGRWTERCTASDQLVSGSIVERLSLCRQRPLGRSSSFRPPCAYEWLREP
jgi:hypothetical protein